jgi:hypothetical protein
MPKFVANFGASELITSSTKLPQRADGVSDVFAVATRPSHSCRVSSAEHYGSDRHFLVLALQVHETRHPVFASSGSKVAISHTVSRAANARRTFDLPNCVIVTSYKSSAIICDHASWIALTYQYRE